MIVFFCLLGFIVGLYFSRNNIFVSIIISLIFLIFILFRFLKKKKIMVIVFAFFTLGVALPPITGMIQNRGSSYSGMVVETRENYFIFQSGVSKYYVYEKDNDREIGDFLVIESEPKDYVITTYESRFSFGDYLIDKGISKTLDSYSIETKFFNPIRLKKIVHEFLSNFDEDTKALIDSFLFSHKDYGNSTIRLIDEMNMIYLLSMSGIYLSFLLRSLEKLFKFFLKDRYAEALPFLILLPYSLFTFPKIGVIRVMLLTLLKYINKHFLKKRFSYFTILSSLALFLLLIDYHLVYQSAYYIGFGLSFTLIFVRTALSKYKKRIQALLIPIFAYAFMLPIMTINGGAVHVLALLFHTVFIPFNEIFIILSLLSFYSTYPFKFLLGEMTKVLKITYSGFYEVDIALPVADYFKYFIFAYFVLYFLFLYFLESGRMVHLKRSYLPMVSLLLISMVPIRTYLINAVYFINVGQGDSILIQNKNKIVMIDTGGNASFDMAKESLIPFLKKRQINHIDLLVTTHSDSDHAGAAQSLINNFNIGTYYTNNDFRTTQVGDVYLENLNSYNADNENDRSLVFNVSFMGKKWLFTGDASVSVEHDMILKGEDLDCDILKVGHHGSKTSTSEEFLLETSPMEAIISCGAKNSYRHPDKEVIDRLIAHGVKIRYTKQEGTISYVQLAT